MFVCVRSFSGTEIGPEIKHELWTLGWLCSLSSIGCIISDPSSHPLWSYYSSAPPGLCLWFSRLWLMHSLINRYKLHCFVFFQMFYIMPLCAKDEILFESECTSDKSPSLTDSVFQQADNHCNDSNVHMWYTHHKRLVLMFSSHVGVVENKHILLRQTMTVENETWEDSTTFLYFDKAALVGLSPTLSFIILPCPWAAHVQLMLRVNDVMSENMENNTWMSHSVSVALCMETEV